MGLTRALGYVEHLEGDGPTIFEHVCRLELEGIVSKRIDLKYQDGLSKAGLRRRTGNIRLFRALGKHSSWRGSGTLRVPDNEPGQSGDRRFLVAMIALAVLAVLGLGGSLLTIR